MEQHSDKEPPTVVTGYNLVGDSTRTCQGSGNWSRNIPTSGAVWNYDQHIAGSSSMLVVY